MGAVPEGVAPDARARWIHSRLLYPSDWEHMSGPACLQDLHLRWHVLMPVSVRMVVPAPIRQVEAQNGAATATRPGPSL